MVGKLQLHGSRGSVGKRVAQDRGGNSGRRFVSGDERAPADELHVDRDLRIGESDGAKRIASLERTLGKAWQTLLAAFSIALRLERLIVELLRGQRPLDEPGEGILALDVKQGERAIVVAVTVGQCRNGRFVSNREILEAAVAVQADIPCADASEGHGDLKQVRIGEDTAVRRQTIGHFVGSPRSDRSDLSLAGRSERRPVSRRRRAEQP